MAPDTVIGLVQGACQIGTGVGQLEAPAAANMRRLDGEGGGAVDLAALDGVIDHGQRVDLARRLEQHAGGVVVRASFSQKGPGSIFECQVQAAGKAGFVGLPALHLARESQFEGCDIACGSADQAAQFGTKGGAVKACGRRRIMGLGGLALHELALDFEQRRQFMVAFGQGAYFGRNAEELAQKIVHVRAQAQQQLRLGPGIQGRGILARFT